MRWPPPTASSALIERTPHVERLPNGAPHQRIHGLSGQGNAIRALQFAEAVEGTPRAVQHPAQ